jgi:hypothetical protein
MGGGEISGAYRHRTGGPGSYAKFPAANPKSPPWDDVRYTSVFGVPAQPVDATQASNLSAGVSNCKVSRGRSFS